MRGPARRAMKFVLNILDFAPHPPRLELPAGGGKIRPFCKGRHMYPGRGGDMRIILSVILEAGVWLTFLVSP